MQQNVGGSPQNAPNPRLLGQLQDCINDCINCHNVCMDRAMSTLMAGEPDHVKTLLDCAEICLASAHSMMRNSGLHGYFCNACQAICMHCAAMCDQMGDRDCANACRACANSCQQILKMIGFS